MQSKKNSEIVEQTKQITSETLIHSDSDNSNDTEVTYVSAIPRSDLPSEKDTTDTPSEVTRVTSHTSASSDLIVETKIAVPIKPIIPVTRAQNNETLDNESGGKWVF